MEEQWLEKALGITGNVSMSESIVRFHVSLRLLRVGYLDLYCPNIADHGKKHLSQLEFLGLVQEQSARDGGRFTDCEPLGISVSRGGMFKVHAHVSRLHGDCKRGANSRCFSPNNEAKVHITTSALSKESTFQFASEPSTSFFHTITRAMNLCAFSSRVMQECLSVKLSM